MADNRISAETKPKPNQANRAALVLQRLGFHILHIGPTVSVQGPQAAWESTFNVSFEAQKKTVVAGLEKGGEITYQRAMTDNMRIPTELQDLIDDIMFMEPPELF